MNLSNSARARTRVHVGGRPQHGFSLVEAMVALLIFSTGVLGIARMQAAATQETTTAALRTVAALQAKNLISTMWLSNRTSATLQTNFSSSPAGSNYTTWLAGVVIALPAGTATVVVSPLGGGGTTPVSASLVVIRVNWQAPGDAAVHTYVETAQIK